MIKKHMLMDGVAFVHAQITHSVQHEVLQPIEYSISLITFIRIPHKDLIYHANAISNAS